MCASSRRPLGTLFVLSYVRGSCGSHARRATVYGLVAPSGCPVRRCRDAYRLPWAGCAAALYSHPSSLWKRTNLAESAAAVQYRSSRPRPDPLVLVLSTGQALSGHNNRRTRVPNPCRRGGNWHCEAIMMALSNVSYELTTYTQC